MSNFENDMTPGKLKPGPNALAHTLAGIAKVVDFFLMERSKPLSEVHILGVLEADSILRICFAHSK